MDLKQTALNLAVCFWDVFWKTLSCADEDPGWVETEPEPGTHVCPFGTGITPIPDGAF
jgi:hypothetical protein